MTALCLLNYWHDGLWESEKQNNDEFTFHPDADCLDLDKKTMLQRLDKILNALYAFEMLSLVSPVKK